MKTTLKCLAAALLLSASTQSAFAGPIKDAMIKHATIASFIGAEKSCGLIIPDARGKALLDEIKSEDEGFVMSVVMMSMVHEQVVQKIEDPAAREKYCSELIAEAREQGVID
ncbi:hypothetical protein PsW64_00628 [Pseudovibrio sp. W64]|uniref:hypothetical protein n=1 Tax=unclassified Pseudovibrio TaxID=2627060 RepID=UPI0007AE3AE9|nr:MULTISPECIES: hypothetical protein [unclassified Pseudovibrio]KZK87322.1 hypothetical protein PsAD13_00591 [Pseudovibrio sp. Ad13]KZK89034.1 hypothetical protein PsAD5_05394 [Pseudovibrio sp. Ad5]KZK89298.1 hypothetical protein PsW64_00628 [Pseudovibrio sp. W64]